LILENYFKKNGSFLLNNFYLMPCLGNIHG
jgi:hypothetical protein